MKVLRKLLGWICIFSGGVLWASAKSKSDHPACATILILNFSDVFNASPYFDGLRHQVILTKRIFQNEADLRRLIHTEGPRLLKKIEACLKRAQMKVNFLNGNLACADQIEPIHLLPQPAQFTHQSQVLAALWYLSFSVERMSRHIHFLDWALGILASRDLVLDRKEQRDYGLIDVAMIFRYFSRYVIDWTPDQTRLIRDQFRKRILRTWAVRERRALEAILNEPWGPPLDARASRTQLRSAQNEVVTLQKTLQVLKAKNTSLTKN